jgi:hypothetical protein
MHSNCTSRNVFFRSVHSHLNVFYFAKNSLWPFSCTPCAFPLLLLPECFLLTISPYLMSGLASTMGSPGTLFMPCNVGSWGGESNLLWPETPGEWYVYQNWSSHDHSQFIFWPFFLSLSHSPLHPHLVCIIFNASLCWVWYIFDLSLYCCF